MRAFPKQSRRSLLQLAIALTFGLALLTIAIPGFCANPSGRLPNVVIILTDDLGYGDIGVFGAKGYQTPRLDRMATEGCVFRDFHVPQAVCSASRAGLLTGCYPNRIGIHGALGPKSKTGLAAEEMTLAELLKQRGYTSAIFGKWHLGDAAQFLPLRQGFDRYFGLPYSNDMWPYHPELARLPLADRKRKGYPDLPLFDGDEVKIAEVTASDQEQLTTWYTEKVVKFIEENQARPFFLYLAHNMPHVPLHVSDKFRGKTSRGLYGDVIEEIDWSVGQVLDALKRTGLEGDTWVIFTSDNGPWLSYGTHAGSAFPLREGKGTSWEGGTRVPCVMRWPGKIPAGIESRQMLMTIDLFPTIAKLVGADLPQRAIDGLDVWPIITAQPGASNPHAAYWFYYEVNELQAVVSGDGHWKLALPHRYRTLNGKPGGLGGLPVDYEYRRLERPELYDLTNDVSEWHDVAARHPGTVAMLQSEAEKARAELGDGLTNRNGRGTRDPGRIVSSDGN
jgi:arylsulfatase A